MKFIFKKHTNKREWISGICTGKGGISSMVVSRLGGFWWALGIFTIKNIRKTLKFEKTRAVKQ